MQGTQGTKYIPTKTTEIRNIENQHPTAKRIPEAAPAQKTSEAGLTSKNVCQRYPISTAVLAALTIGAGITTGVVLSQKSNPGPDNHKPTGPIDPTKVQPPFGENAKEFCISNDIVKQLFNGTPESPFAFLYSKEGNTAYSIGVPGHASAPKDVDTHQTVNYSDDETCFPTVLSNGLSEYDNKADVYENSKARHTFLLCGIDAPKISDDIQLSEFTFGDYCDWQEPENYCLWNNRNTLPKYEFAGAYYSLTNPSDAKFMVSEDTTAFNWLCNSFSVKLIA